MSHSWLHINSVTLYCRLKSLKKSDPKWERKSCWGEKFAYSTWCLGKSLSAVFTYLQLYLSPVWLENNDWSSSHFQCSAIICLAFTVSAAVLGLREGQLLVLKSFIGVFPEGWIDVLVPGWPEHFCSSQCFLTSLSLVKNSMLFYLLSRSANTWIAQVKMQITSHLRLNMRWTYDVFLKTTVAGITFPHLLHIPCQHFGVASGPDRRQASTHMLSARMSLVQVCHWFFFFWDA